MLLVQFDRQIDFTEGRRSVGCTPLARTVLEFKGELGIRDLLGFKDYRYRLVCFLGILCKSSVSCLPKRPSAMVKSVGIGRVPRAKRDGIWQAAQPIRFQCIKGLKAGVCSPHSVSRFSASGPLGQARSV